jgi:integrase
VHGPRIDRWQSMHVPRALASEQESQNYPSSLDAMEGNPGFCPKRSARRKCWTCREALEFVILSAARSGEIRNMRWAEVDLEKKVWTCPAETMKGGTAHRVPLSWRMKGILESQKRRTSHPTLVFPSPRGKVLSDNTLSKFLRDHRVLSDTPSRTAVVHGFRSSFRDWSAESNYAEHILEICLAHKERRVVAAYKRTDLLEQRVPIMNAWADCVCRPQGPPKT